MEYKDYYKVLGVERSASQDEIRKAYRKLARKYHPDVSKEADAENRFKEVNEANEVLGDADKRKQYDALGSSWQGGDPFRQQQQWHHSHAGAGNAGFDASFFEDIARQQNGAQGNNAGFSDFFDSLFGGGMGNGRGTRRPAEAQTLNVTLDLEDSYHGHKKTLRLPNGQNVQVKIPKGIMDGKKIRLSGKGGQGQDLHLKVHLRPHPDYILDGQDILHEVAIAPWEAALGGSIPVKTLDGTIKLKVPPNTHSGKKMRLKGKGLPGKTTGDFYVTLTIRTPPADTEQQKNLYKEMKQVFTAWDARTELT